MPTLEHQRLITKILASRLLTDQALQHGSHLVTSPDTLSSRNHRSRHHHHHSRPKTEKQRDTCRSPPCTTECCLDWRFSAEPEMINQVKQMFAMIKWLDLYIEATLRIFLSAHKRQNTKFFTSMLKPPLGSFCPCIAGSLTGGKPPDHSTHISRTDMTIILQMS